MSLMERAYDEIYIPEDECCMCLSSGVIVRVSVQSFVYPFCHAHSLRARFLQQGSEHNWPALRIPDEYAVDNTPQGWVLVACFGTNECVAKLLHALEEKFPDTREKVVAVALQNQVYEEIF